MKKELESESSLSLGPRLWRTSSQERWVASPMSPYSYIMAHCRTRRGREKLRGKAGCWNSLKSSNHVSWATSKSCYRSSTTVLCAFVTFLCTCSVAGVGPRKFRTGVTDLGDRSVWTDTPADKLRKAMVSGEETSLYACSYNKGTVPTLSGWLNPNLTMSRFWFVSSTVTVIHWHSN